MQHLCVAASRARWEVFLPGSFVSGFDPSSDPELRTEVRGGGGRKSPPAKLGLATSLSEEAFPVPTWGCLPWSLQGPLQHAGLGWGTYAHPPTLAHA